MLAGSVVTVAADAMLAWPEEIPFGQSRKNVQIGLCFAEVGLRLRRSTQTRSEAHRHSSRCLRSDFRERALFMLASTSSILRFASFFHLGPTGSASRNPFRNSLISPGVKPMSLANRIRSTRFCASPG